MQGMREVPLSSLTNAEIDFLQNFLPQELRLRQSFYKCP